MKSPSLSAEPEQGASRGEADRTDSCNDEDNAEGVHHRRDREAQSGQQLPPLLDLPEDPDHSDGPEAEDEADGQVDWGQADERRPDHGEVEKAPAVGEEGRKPLGVEVQGELGREEYGEE